MTSEIEAAIDELERAREQLGYLAAMGADEERIDRAKSKALVAHKDLVDAIRAASRAAAEQQYEAGIETGRAAVGT